MGKLDYINITFPTLKLMAGGLTLPYYYVNLKTRYQLFIIDFTQSIVFQTEISQTKSSDNLADFETNHKATATQVETCGEAVALQRIV